MFLTEMCLIIPWKKINVSVSRLQRCATGKFLVPQSVSLIIWHLYMI